MIKITWESSGVFDREKCMCQVTKWNNTMTGIGKEGSDG